MSLSFHIRADKITENLFANDRNVANDITTSNDDTYREHKQLL